MTIAPHDIVPETQRAILPVGVEDPAPPIPDVPEPSNRWLTWGLTTENGGLSDIAEYLGQAAFAEGREPYAYRASINKFKKGAWRLPDGGRLLRAVDSKGYAIQIAVGDGWTLQLVRWQGGRGSATVTAISPGLARETAETAAKLVAGRIKKTRDDAVRMGFWHMGGNGPERQVRPIDAPPWSAIRRNYAASAAERLESLMAVTPDEVNGRLVLLHGPPGTGKTSALRALGLAWQDWCKIDCVLDPEAMLAGPGYLLQVVMGAEYGPDKRKWRLLILEDCDELVRGEAKRAAGQALSRLLNLTDGLLGQGQNTLVAITTNEELGRLHPAIVRPGRCLAQIEVGPLPRAEAAAWLGTQDGLTGPETTLAELYALQGGQVADQEAPAPIGQYL